MRTFAVLTRNSTELRIAGYVARYHTEDPDGIVLLLYVRDDFDESRISATPEVVRYEEVLT